MYIMQDYLYGIDDYVRKYSSYCKKLLYESNTDIEVIRKLSIIPTFLFYGLPSTGKTSTAHLIYEELKKEHNIDRYIFRMDQYTSYNFGESSKNLIEFFEKIKCDINTNNSKAFIIIDEIDSFTINRYHCDNDSIRRILLTFNKILDTLIASHEIYNMVIVATTNIIDSIDSATLRRFYFKQSFDSTLTEEQFKEYIGELCRVSSLQCDNTDDLFLIYKEKNFTLGELKRFFADKYMENTCIGCSDNSIDIDKFKETKSFYEYCNNQQEVRI